ncbi:unnamed protein product [Cladocopium goreaui]|uniref:Outer membrane efflux protein n=1 Tax=Cladocopium goreaui TaxID=2562237 RepID=A0A9P1BEX0_9DINO|nr:unnamed protein product [Cladocopium goreaui]
MPTSQPNEATAWLVVAESISLCGRRMRGALSSALSEVELGDAQFSLLWNCLNSTAGGSSQRHLAEALSVSPAHVSSTLEQLRRLGFLKSQRCETDRRRQVWVVTPEGRNVVHRVVNRLQPWATQLANELGSESQEELLGLLQALLKLLGDLELEASNPNDHDNGNSRLRGLLGLALILTAWLGGSGCSLPYYREQADWDAYRLIHQKNEHPHWYSGRYNININPRSRMYDPYDPDCEPMPPDDPVANRLMHTIDGKQAYPCWYKNGTTPYVQNPMWAQYLETDEEGELVLKMNQAVLLARLNSTEYQGNLEDLYLSALDVAFERFRFDTQFFASTDTNGDFDGRDIGGQSSSILNVNNDVEARRLFASGGELVAGFANSFVWQFAGTDTYAASSLLDFSLLQPLLRGGTRAVVLETLTISERVLLYNVRQMERYRKGFYVEVTTGRSAGPGPNRRGGLFGGAGLTGFTGVGGGGFGGVGGGGGGFAGGAGAAQAGGYLGLLQDQQQIRNQEANVAGLRDSLAQLQATYDAGRIDRFQVDLALQALYNAQSRLLSTKAAYESSLDNFKVSQLGLPPDVPVETNDSILDQFNLIDPGLTEIQNSVGDVLENLRDAGNNAEEISIDMDAADAVRAKAAAHLAIVEEDLEKLDEALPERRESLEKLRRSEELQKGNVNPAAYSIEDMEQRAEQLHRDFKQLVVRLEETFGALRNLAADAEQLPTETARTLLIDTLTSLSGELVDLMLIQARSRLESATLIDIDLDPHTAYMIALNNRLDIMNARGNLVDTWRLITFNANRLEGELNISLEGDLGTNDDKPFRFRGTSGSLRAGIEFDAPITRLEERNLYRQSLIEYQQARRSFYELRDQLYQGLRNTLRTVELNKLNFELRRAAVLTAINQVEVTQLRLNQPPQPGEQSQLGATTARDLVSALSDLLSVQNDFLSVWVNNEVQRVGLDFDLGTMRLDKQGLWVDPGPITAEALGAPTSGEADADMDLIPPGNDDQSAPGVIPPNVPSIEEALPLDPEAEPLEMPAPAVPPTDSIQLELPEPKAAKTTQTTKATTTVRLITAEAPPDDEDGDSAPASDDESDVPEEKATSKKDHPPGGGWKPSKPR